MINEIFISKWTSPVVPIPCMSPAQLDNELERIYSRMTSKYRQTSLGPKIDPDREFDRGFKTASRAYTAHWLAGYEMGYKNGRDAEARHQDKSL